MKIFVALIAILTCCLSASAKAQDIDARLSAQSTRAIIENIIRPGYRDFAGSAYALKRSMAALCAAPDAASVDAAREAFRDAATAWAEIEMFRFGPAIEENRLERVLFFPDRKSTGLKQVQRIIAQKDESAINDLSEKSVAVQGLGAIEFILFGNASEDVTKSGHFRCAYGFAIAANLAALGKDLDDDWNKQDSIAARLLEPSDSDPQYGSPVDVLNEFLGVAIHGLEAIQDQRIRPLLKADGQNANPKRSLLWRSNMTFGVIERNLASIATLLEKNTLGALLGEDINGTLESLQFEFRQARSAIAALQGRTPKEATADNALLGKLTYLDLVIGNLIERLDTEFAGAIGLSAGFSFADGD